VLVVASVVEVMPVVVEPATHIPALHVRPGSQPPPPVHMQPSEPTAQPSVVDDVFPSVVDESSVSPWLFGWHENAQNPRSARGSALNQPRIA
jgi:hypothetical protein